MSNVRATMSRWRTASLRDTRAKPAKADIAKAQQLVQQSGTAGQNVTVWGEQRAPRTQYVEYYASVLNKIGFKATPKIIASVGWRRPSGS